MDVNERLRCGCGMQLIERCDYQENGIYTCTIECRCGATVTATSQKSKLSASRKAHKMWWEDTISANWVHADTEEEEQYRINYGPWYDSYGNLRPKINLCLCGKSARFRMDKTFSNHIVLCDCCATKTPAFKTMVEAATAWNNMVKNANPSVTKKQRCLDWLQANYDPNKTEFELWDMAEAALGEAEECDLEMILKANRFLRDKPVSENICKKLIKKIVIRNLRIHKMQTETEHMHRKFNTRMDKILKSWKRGQIDDYALVKSTLRWKREVEMGDPHYLILTECASACVIKTIENHRKVLAQGVHNE